MDDKTITMVDKLKYLGVVLDKRLTFRPHLEHVAERASKLLPALTAVTRPTWGLNSKLLKVIYRGAVEPMILYCAAVLEDTLHKRWAQEKLSQIQRGYLLRIIRGYRTTSTAASQIVAGIEPLFLTGLYKANLSNMKQGRKSPQYISHLQLEVPVHPLSAGHPSLHIPGFNEICTVKFHRYSIYTDGSRLEEQPDRTAKVGCAFVVYREHTELSSAIYKLAPECSVFQAELIAIKEAVKWCDSNNHSACIHSDSQSALFAINNKYNYNPIASEIRNLILNCTAHVCFSWVKGHIGIEGNERADELAKLAANSDLPHCYNLCPVSHVKLIMKEDIIQKWNEQWRNNDKGVLTKELYFPTVFDRLKCKLLTPNFVLTQFLTGHGGFTEYLHRFHLKPSPECICGEDTQNVTHILFDCPLFHCERYELKLLLESVDCTFSKPLTNILANRKSYKYFISFLNTIFLKIKLYQ